jgi:hypothetical protein
MRTNVSTFDVNNVQIVIGKIIKKEIYKSQPDNESVRLNSSIPTLKKLP